MFHQVGRIGSRLAIPFKRRNARLWLDFTSGNQKLDSRITFSRASNATVVGKDGTIQYAPHNLLTYSEQFDNAAWANDAFSGGVATVTANAVAAPDGTTTADTVMFTASTNQRRLQAKTSISTGVTHTFSIYVKKGSLSSVVVVCDYINAPYIGIAYNFDTDTLMPGTGITASRVIGANGWVRIIGSWAALGTSVYCGLASTSTGTVQVWGAQLNVGALQPYYPTTVKNLLGYTQEFDNAAWTKSNSFIQTNQIRNNTMQGAVAGTPGTLPTNWQQAVVSNLSSSIVGVGVEDGVSYIDYRLYGTINASNSSSLQFEQNSAVSAANGQAWTLSTYLKVVAGSTSGISSIRLGWEERSTIYLQSDQGTNFTPASSGSLAANRNTFSFTLNNASTAYIKPYIQFTPVNGATIDLTIRIGLPQLVQGATAGDVVATYGTAKAVMYQAPDGTLSADKLVEDTATSFHRITPTAVTVVSGTTITTSVYAKAAERTGLGLFPYSSAAGSRFNLATGTVTSQDSGVTASIVSVGNGWFRCSASIVAPGTSAAPWILPLNASNATSYTGDGTSGIYIWGAQLSDSTSLDPYVYNPGAAPTAAAYYGPRFDYDPVTLQPKGLLIEEQRTNSIRNNTMVGAVAGTPGTLPTNWGVLALASGLSSEIVSVSTSNGIAYIDYKISGTTSNASSLNLVFDSNTAIAAASGQTWTGSSYIAIVGGNFTNISSASLRVTERTGAGGFVGATETSIATATNSLIANKFIATRTLGATAGAVQLGVFLSIASGVNVDCTLRIGMPQLEQGSFASSVIPTSGAQATRAADVATMTGTNFSSWYNQNEGTLFAEFDVVGLGSTTNYNGALSVDDGSINNAIELSMWDAASDGLRWVGYVGGTPQWSINPKNYLPNSVVKGAGTYKANSFNAAFDGVLGAEDTLGSVPVVNLLRIGVNRGGNSNYLNGHIKRLTYFPKRLANTELQALTS